LASTRTKFRLRSTELGIGVPTGGKGRGEGRGEEHDAGHTRKISGLIFDHFDDPEAFVLDAGEQEGIIEGEDRKLLQSIVDFGDTIVREVMVPRTEVVWIERGKTVGQALALALRSGFSRIPVIGENVDDVIGVVYLKDLAARAQDGQGRATRVEEIMRPALFVPESKPVDELLREMQARRTHIAIVIDEYGGTAGLVTIEDILEEIVGEIADEYDTEERPPVEHLADGSIRVTARLPVEDLGELFDVELDGDDVETVGGLLAQALGRVPIPGSAATVEGLRLVAEGTTGRRNRIDSVLVWRAPDENADHPDLDHEDTERQAADV